VPPPSLLIDGKMGPAGRLSVAQKLADAGYDTTPIAPWPGPGFAQKGHSAQKLLNLHKKGSTGCEQD
jgi:hypothetical protein